jgi:acetoin utilization protein AcuB
MIPNPITIDHHQSVQEAMQVMARYKIRHLPVIKEGELAGIVSDRDIRQLGKRPSLKLPVNEEEEAYLNLPIEEVMTPGAITVREYDTVQTVIEFLIKNTIGALPVVDRQGRLVGVLSQTDILKYCLDLLGREEERSSD